MACTHLNGGLQVLTRGQGGWQSHCLLCGGHVPESSVTLPEEAGQAAALGALHRAQGRMADAAEAFRRAARLGGDPRCLFAALLCRLGVTFCGDEMQPTFSAAQLPGEPLTDSPEWRALEAAAHRLPPYAWQALNESRQQLQQILDHMARAEGRSACDVFLCYRRTRSNVHQAMALYADLKKRGLRVFCADVTTRGKTQEEFEAEVYHALQTAEYMVLLPGDGAEALTPWLQNELNRAACPKANRFVAADGHRELPHGLGEALSLNEIRMRLAAAAGDCAPERLYQRALAALAKEDALMEARALLHRASAGGCTKAQLLAAILYEEGLIFPRDAARAAHYRRLCGEAGEACRREVFSDLAQLEEARHIARRRPLVYVAADVSDAGLASSQAMMRPLFSAMSADRRLAGAEICLIGYDLHARVLSEPRALEKYGLPEQAARLLHTSPEGGSDRRAHAAKGLRCAADHLLRTGAGEGATPLLALLNSGVASDGPGAVPAALAAVESLFANAPTATVVSAEQVKACIEGILKALRTDGSAETVSAQEEAPSHPALQPESPVEASGPAATPAPGEPGGLEAPPLMPLLAY